MSKNYRKEFPTTDIVITIARREVVLIERAKPPFEDKLVFPGGHVDEGEKCVEACAREAGEEVGFNVEASDLDFLHFLDDPTRDPRPGHGLSLVFTVDVPDREALGNIVAASDAKEIHIRDIDSLSEDEMGFDHYEAILVLRRRFNT